MSSQEDEENHLSTHESDQYDFYTQEDKQIFNAEEQIVDYISKAEENPLSSNSLIGQHNGPVIM